MSNAEMLFLHAIIAVAGCATIWYSKDMRPMISRLLYLAMGFFWVQYSIREIIKLLILMEKGSK